MGARVLASVALAIVGCGGPTEQFDTGPIADETLSAPVRISADAAHEEDPTIVAARDGTFRVVWWAKRDGQIDLYGRTSRDGRTWTDEVRITNDPDDDLYPWLLQTRDGTMHLVWFRMAGPTGAKSVWYARSSGAGPWSPPRLMSGTSESWVPSAYEDSNRVLWLLWSSEESGPRKIVAVSSTDSGLTWSASRPLTRGAGEDDFPQVVQTGSGERVLAWTRYRAGSPQSDYINDASAEVLTARSRSGVDWPNPITTSPADPDTRYLDFLPHLFADRAQRQLFLAWTSNRPGRRGDILVRDLSAPAAPIRQLTTTSGSDYGARIVATSQPGEYLMVWTSDALGGTHVLARRIRL
jgi:hypothetical protein